MSHFKLTSETTVTPSGVTLFRIEATVDIPSRGIKKGDRGGFVEKESNLEGNAQVYGNAWVYGDAQVYGDALVSAKKAFTKGWFIGGDDSEKITRIENELGTGYWAAQYVLGDYEITDIEEEQPQTINIGGTEYEVTEELTNVMKNLKEKK